MGGGGFLAAGGLAVVVPGSLLGSTLALAMLWGLRQTKSSQLAYPSQPLRPSGYRIALPRASTPLQLTEKEASPAFQDWVFLTTKRFYGKPWLLQTSGRPDVLIVSSPEALEDIQRTFAAQFEKVDDLEPGLARGVHGEAMASPFSGSNRRVSSQTRRKLAAAVLNSPVLCQAASELVGKHLKSLQKILKQATNGSEPEFLDVTKLTRRFTMEVFAELGLGLQLGGLSSLNSEASAFESAVNGIQERLTQRSSQPTVLWKLGQFLNVGDEAAITQNVEMVNATVLSAVGAKQRRREGLDNKAGLPPTHSDMLSLLLARRNSGKIASDPAFLAEVALGLALAARDATAHTLSMCLYCLAQCPDEQQKLLEELQGDRRHVYLDAVVKETLRLFPAQPFVRRRAKEDVVLSDGTFVASGTEVVMATYSTARREDAWGPDAEQFRPERWLNAETGKLRPVSSYRFNAFLGGPHACLGVEMTQNHVKPVLLGILSQFHVATAEMESCKADFKGKGASTGHIPSSDGTVRATFQGRDPGPLGEFS